MTGEVFRVSKMAPLKQRLGVNVDHVATVRNARGTPTQIGRAHV